MFAAYDPSSGLESVKLGFLLAAAGMMVFWRSMIKLLLIAVIVLVTVGIITILHTLP